MNHIEKIEPQHIICLFSNYEVICVPGNNIGDLVKTSQEINTWIELAFDKKYILISLGQKKEKVNCQKY